LLRSRSIQCAASDVKLSLLKCCGAAALYGLLPLSIGVGLGLEAVSDIAGESISAIDGVSLLPLPPLSIMLDQELVEEPFKTSDGLIKKNVHLRQQLCSFAVSATDECLKLVPLDISMRLNTPSTAPLRVSASVTQFQSAEDRFHPTPDPPAPPLKRVRLDTAADNVSSLRFAEDLTVEASRFAAILASTLETDES
jgi:hypothetical protein